MPDGTPYALTLLCQLIIVAGSFLRWVQGMGAQLTGVCLEAATRMAICSRSSAMSEEHCTKYGHQPWTYQPKGADFR